MINNKENNTVIFMPEFIDNKLNGKLLLDMYANT